MRKLEKAVNLIQNVVEVNEETNRYYLNIDKEYEPVRELIHKHDILLDDYQLKWFDEAIDEMLNGVNLDYFSYKDIENYEFEYLVADCYTSELTEWLNSRNERVYYITEVLEEFEIKDGFNLLQEAQLREMSEVYENAKYILIEWLKENE